jgi:hypothetical protein
MHFHLKMTNSKLDNLKKIFGWKQFSNIVYQIHVNSPTKVSVELDKRGF